MVIVEPPLPPDLLLKVLGPGSHLTFKKGI